LQVCIRCVMDNKSDATIKFEADGTCNYCNDALNRMKNEYFPDKKGKDMLDAIMTQIKQEGKGKQYDCIVGVSGGVDSSYVIYLGYQYELRMLAVHIDDGLDTEIAVKNIKNICAKTKTEIINIRPQLDQYRDVIRAFFLARVPNLAMLQDNIIHASLNDIAKKYNINYNLSGANFALESILERSTGINALDRKHIIALHKQFGQKRIDKLRMATFYEVYINNRYFQRIKKVLPLNFINYNLKNALDELAEFSDYIYYGGKHYESILTRFLQCYYLPTKYNFDKRKSHFSSMIVSGQLTREDAMKQLSKRPYINDDLKEFDFNYLAHYLEMSREEFNSLMSLTPRYHHDYSTSFVNNFAHIARRFRKYLG